MTRQSWGRLAWFLVIVAGLFWFTYDAGRRSGRKSALADFQERTDTLFIFDKIVQNRPVPVDSFPAGRFPVPVPDTIRVSDTITITCRDTIYLPRVTKVYSDSTFRAVVSGVAPSLDEIQVFPRSSIIYRDRVQFVPKKTRWGLGIQAGLGLAVPLGAPASPPIRAAPYIGIGVSYNLITW